MLLPGDRENIVVGADESCIDDAESLDDATQRLVFIAGPEAEPCWRRSAEHALTHWIDTARRIRRHLQSHATRCLAVDAAEARGAFADLVALCRGRFGLALTGPDAGSFAKAEAPGDPLHQLLSAILVQSSRQAGPLLEELRHTCTPLSNASTSPPAAFDATRALARLRQLRGRSSKHGASRRRRRSLPPLGIPARSRKCGQKTNSCSCNSSRHMSSAEGSRIDRGRHRLGAMPDAEPIEIEKLVLGSARNEPPHREMTLTLLGLKFGPSGSASYCCVWWSTTGIRAW